MEEEVGRLNVLDGDGSDGWTVDDDGTEVWKRGERGMRSELDASGKRREGVENSPTKFSPEGV